MILLFFPLNSSHVFIFFIQFFLKCSNFWIHLQFILLFNPLSLLLLFKIHLFFFSHFWFFFKIKYSFSFICFLLFSNKLISFKFFLLIYTFNNLFYLNCMQLLQSSLFFNLHSLFIFESSLSIFHYCLLFIKLLFYSLKLLFIFSLRLQLFLLLVYSLLFS